MTFWIHIRQIMVLCHFSLSIPDACKDSPDFPVVALLLMSLVNVQEELLFSYNNTLLHNLYHTAGVFQVQWLVCWPGRVLAVVFAPLNNHVFLQFSTGNSADTELVFSSTWSAWIETWSSKYGECLRKATFKSDVQSPFLMDIPNHFTTNSCTASVLGF